MSVVPYTPFDLPPMIVDPVVTLTAATSVAQSPLALFNSAASIYWSWPKLRSTTLYGASFWTNNNMGSFTASKVNDGDLVSTAFTLATAGDGSVNGDFGSAVAFREFWIYYTTQFPATFLNVEYSDDNSTWFSAGANNALIGQNPAVGSLPAYLQVLVVPVSVGAHRYWRVRKSAAVNAATTVVEVWPRIYGDDYLSVEEFRVYSGSGLYARVPRLNAPTAGNPLDLKPMLNFYNASYAVAGLLSIGVSVTVVSSGHQNESYGYVSNPAPSATLTAPSPTITLANGANQNIDSSKFTSPSTYAKFVEVTGPTGAFSLGGFASPSGSFVFAEEFEIYNNTTQAMTINNEDAGSTAANRIKTLTGANVALAAGASLARFRYSTAISRWLLIAARDNTGAI